MTRRENSVRSLSACVLTPPTYRADEYIVKWERNKKGRETLLVHFSSIPSNIRAYEFARKAAASSYFHFQINHSPPTSLHTQLSTYVDRRILARRIRVSTDRGKRVWALGKKREEYFYEGEHITLRLESKVFKIDLIYVKNNELRDNIYELNQLRADYMGRGHSFIAKHRKVRKKKENSSTKTSEMKILERLVENIGFSDSHWAICEAKALRDRNEKFVCFSTVHIFLKACETETFVSLLISDVNQPETITSLANFALCLKIVKRSFKRRNWT